MTPEGMLHWLATTDAKLTYVGGDPINPLTTLNTAAVMVVYCSTRILNVCGGTCNVYNGGNTCLYTPNAACMASTKNVVFCSTPYCSGTCGELASCPAPLDGGFCATPGVQSIFTPADHPTA
ncbi:hypothetical protein C8Q80DRAFT_232687 [Daedaleopsis nitida]|nr:hypothetical protein C8Q80DRAFT_232687 [Daedaleopsis nitida]